MNDKGTILGQANLLELKLKHKQKALKCFLEDNIPEETLVDVKRGNGIWTVAIVGFDGNRSAGYFRGRSQNGKIHTFHFSQITEIYPLEDQ